MNEKTGQAPPPSLVIRDGGVTVRLREDGVHWQGSGTVTRIPYQAIGAVTTTDGATGGAWVRLRITLRPAVTEFGGRYELACPSRQGRPFAAALERLVSDRGTALHDHDVPRQLGVTVTPVRSLPLRERHSPVRLAWFALLAATLVSSLALLALGHPVRAVVVWAAVPAWAVTALVARVLAFGFAGVRDPWTRGIRVEARHVDSRTGHSSGGPWPEFVYEFTDPDGVRREHALRPSGRFSRPRPTRTLWFVPGDAPRGHTLGDPFTALFITVMAGGMALFLGGIAAFLMPGLLMGALLGFLGALLG
ncbi:hypothetical protein U9R90_11950 [Streptomyces sp. E11-3]|uniref:hypothetical protein n=1 Tax=Streptomyces sp. E11-3 TaxID=3110112 RepID=UPI0039809596